MFLVISVRKWMFIFSCMTTWSFFHVSALQAQPTSFSSVSQAAPVKTYMTNRPAMLFTLPLAGNKQPRLWNLREHIGIGGIVLVIVRPQARKERLQINWRPLALRLGDVARSRIQSQGLQAVLVLPGNVVAAQTVSSPSALTVLHDAKAQLSRHFAGSQAVAGVVMLDRAGFVRRIQPVAQANDLPRALLQIFPADADLSHLLPPLPQVGNPAPDFTVPDMNGTLQSLSSYRGRKNVLLTFFPKCFTGNCRTHLTSVRDAYPQLQQTDTVVFGISTDPAEGPHGQKAFAQNLNLPFLLLPDTNRNLSLLYGAAASPEMMAARISILIDKQGVVRWIDKQIDPQTHGQDVVAKIQDLKMDNAHLQQ